MRIIAKRTLREFWTKYPDSQGQLQAWHSEVLNANWKNPQELKQLYGSASILKDGRAVFNICGNTYRIVVWINYKFGLVFVKYIGTHEQYDNIDANTV
ncbi:MAG: type II toxin-antitoxin system HigB family toxin [Gammaproteobacteria bacterium]|nr:MAG: type II toxin-antitoxin system HigB family toxin [Gammaproteobacteria bacterium]